MHWPGREAGVVILPPLTVGESVLWFDAICLPSEKCSSFSWELQSLLHFEMRLISNGFDPHIRWLWLWKNHK